MFQSLLYGMGQLLAYFYSLVPNYGVAIIMLTILVRTAMIPLAIKQAHSMQANRGNAEKMRKLQPEVKKIKEKYKEDRQRQYEEQKKLYEDHGVNMLGGLNGCLPVLLQTPIFFAMYAVLQGCSKVIGARNCVPGFHIPKDSPLYTAIVEQTATFLGTNLEFRPAEVFGQFGPVRALPYAVLVGVMGGTMWYQTQMMMKAQPAPDPQFAATQKVMKFMPVMLVVFSWNFPAGLILYWSASNAWTIGQQWLLMKRYGGILPEKSESKPPRGSSGKPAVEAADDRPAKPIKPAPKRPATHRPSGKQAPAAQAKKGAGAPSRPGGGQKGAGTGSNAGGGGSGARRPAAKQARPAASGAGAAVNGQKGKRSAAAGSGKNGADSPETPRTPAAKPKGSGARKGNKGRRR